MHSPFLAVFIREPINNLSCVKVQYAERPFLAFGQTLTHTQSMILFPEGNNRRLFPSAPTASRIAVKRAALVGGVGWKAPRFIKKKSKKMNNKNCSVSMPGNFLRS